MTATGLRGTTFRRGGSVACPPSLAAALATDGVDSIFAMRELLTVSKVPAASWDALLPHLIEALGGASGGFTAARKEIVSWLRQRSRPYLFSNALAPAICAASITALDLIEESDSLLGTLRENTAFFRKELSALGFDLLPGEHAIIPVMLGDAKLASEMADALLDEGIYVIGFSFPVVPRGAARIRTQMSAGLSHAQLERAVAAFAKVGRQFGVIP